MAVKGIGNQAAYQGVQNNNSISNNGNGINQRVSDNSAQMEDSLKIRKISGINGEEKEQTGDSRGDLSRMEKAVKAANNKLTKTKCEFSYNDEVNRISIRVIDKETDKVIKEIPPEESFKALEKIWEIAGLLVDEKR